MCGDFEILNCIIVSHASNASGYPQTSIHGFNAALIHPDSPRTRFQVLQVVCASDVDAQTRITSALPPPCLPWSSTGTSARGSGCRATNTPKLQNQTLCREGRTYTASRMPVCPIRRTCFEGKETERPHSPGRSCLADKEFEIWILKGRSSPHRTEVLLWNGCWGSMNRKSKVSTLQKQNNRNAVVVKEIRDHKGLGLQPLAL